MASGEDEDPWAELFDRAEGKISTLGNNVGGEQGFVGDTKTTVRSKTTAAAANGPKLHHHGTTNNKTSKAAAARRSRNHGNLTNDRDYYNSSSFQEYLEERSICQTQLHVKTHIVLKEAFSTTIPAAADDDPMACHEWKGTAAVPAEGQPQPSNQTACSSSTCQTCGRSSFYHRASVVKKDDNQNNSNHDNRHGPLLPLQLYCMLRNLRHVAILYLTNTTYAEEQTMQINDVHVVNCDDDDDDKNEVYLLHVDRAFLQQVDECKRLVKILKERGAQSSQPELSTSLQTNFAALQTMLDQHQQQAFKKRNKQHSSTSTNSNKSSTSSRRKRQQQQAAREEATRMIMQCDECYYQLYYLEISQQLIAAGLVVLFSSSSRGRADMFIPHPMVYFGEGFSILRNETSRSSNHHHHNNNKKKHYLDLARDLVSTWNTISLDHDASVVARFQLDFDQQQQKAAALGKASPMGDMDALSVLHYIRFLETITFFELSKHTSWLSSSSASSASLLSKRNKSSSSSSPSSSSLTSPPPAPSLLMEWRDSCRDFLTHLYAYATLPPKLISHILKACGDVGIDNIVEMGAGTGYVAHLLTKQQQQQQRQEGTGGSNDNVIIGIEAYDLLPTTPPPPSSCSAYSTQMNEYHGETPPFSLVAKACCTQALQNNNKSNVYSKTALLLCFPPPDSSMALDAVQLFSNNSSNSTSKKRRRQQRQDRSRGDESNDLISNGSGSAAATTSTGAAAGSGSLVIYIGEFQGLTGTRELERYLMRNFDCIARHACPTWGTDSTSVTIWKVKGKPPSALSKSSPPSSLSFLIPCHYCQEKAATKRLCCIRHLEYCSNACFLADCRAGVVNQHATCSRLYLGGDMTFARTNGAATAAAVNDTTGACALDFANKQHFLDLAQD